MKIGVNNKKVLIVMLIILMLLLAVGYAIFSEVLTISGTANAKGTFDLEFQNAEIVKSIGVNKENTTAQISEDKNTLTVNVADLSYPGAGVEFSVDIVNVGTMPAEIQAVTTTNITGSDKIKVTGLEGIKVGHPTLEVGDRCNIHFTVEWPEDVTEILDTESSISFGLQIEYTQATVEKFEGNVLHIDTDKSGNIINNTIQDEGNVGEIPENALIKQITAEDYGKSINYVATVKGQKVSNWKILYNDKNNIYLILDDFLPIELVPEETGLNVSGSYVIKAPNGDNLVLIRELLLKGLETEEYWKEFANGIEGVTATGAPTVEILLKSYNEKYKTDFDLQQNVKLENIDTLYLPFKEENNEIKFYWLANKVIENSNQMKCVSYRCYVTNIDYSRNDVGTRPVVKLPSTVVGTVGETVEIK